MRCTGYHAFPVQSDRRSLAFAGVLLHLVAMFGYRLVHKDVLAHLMRPSVAVGGATSWATTPGVSVAPAPRPVSEHVTLPKPVEEALERATAVWGQSNAPALTALAAEMLAEGQEPDIVAQRLMDGDEVVD